MLINAICSESRFNVDISVEGSQIEMSKRADVGAVTFTVVPVLAGGLVPVHRFDTKCNVLLCLSTSADPILASNIGLVLNM